MLVISRHTILSTWLKDYVSLRAGEALFLSLPPFENEE
jgi:hypothetical protein